MTVYALKHPDGRWLYNLPEPENFRFKTRTGTYADGQPMQELHRGWWAADHEATRLTTTAQPAPKTVSYALNDPAAESARYPATLTVEAYSDRQDSDDNLYSLYDPVREEQPALEHVYDGPIVVLEGREPPAPDQPQWIARLPHQLADRPEYQHLFPGHIPGLVDHLMTMFKAMPRVEHVFDNFQNTPGVYVSLRIPYDQPRTEWRAYTGRKGQPLKSGRNVTVMASRSLTLPIPSRIAADTYAEALSVWEQQVTYWTGVVEQASVAACSHCNGHGFITDGSEKYSRSLYS
ncbi:hypothetical protein ACFW9D_05845 [Streptomyces sp. NPDC059524]|uniref:hypothetical protein n=1 Tax=Streptomyces sp. NPDC059524 TaxID=3346856 RepID=UPI0036CC4178